jgi:hypothetical protein
MSTDKKYTSTPFASAQAVTHTVQAALGAGTYYWRVRGKDPAGSNTWGDWSAVRSFIIEGAPPSPSSVTPMLHMMAQSGGLL